MQCIRILTDKESDIQILWVIHTLSRAKLRDSSRIEWDRLNFIWCIIELRRLTRSMNKKKQIYSSLSITRQ